MTDTTPPSSPTKSYRGFAAMDPARQRELASRGGRAAHERGTAHEFSSEEARRAGQRGGAVVSRDRQHMAAIGSRGGRNRGNGTAAHQVATATPANGSAIPGDTGDGRNGTITQQAATTATRSTGGKAGGAADASAGREHQPSEWNDRDLQPMRRTPRSTQEGTLDRADEETADDKRGS